MPHEENCRCNMSPLHVRATCPLVCAGLNSSEFEIIDIVADCDQVNCCVPVSSLSRPNIENREDPGDEVGNLVPLKTCLIGGRL